MPTFVAGFQMTAHAGHAPAIADLFSGLFRKQTAIHLFATQASESHIGMLDGILPASKMFRCCEYITADHRLLCLPVTLQQQDLCDHGWSQHMTMQIRTPARLSALPRLAVLPL